MTSLGKEYTCIMLAIINIKKEMVGLGSQERVDVAKMCNKAVTKKTEKDTKYIEWIEDGSMGVQIVISPEAIQVHCEEYLVSHFQLDDIKVMMSFPKSEANLVIVGQCSKKGRLVALVFDLLSDQQAEQCIHAIAKAAGKENSTSSQPKICQPSLPVPPISKPTYIRTISSPPVASIAEQNSQPKPQFISERNPSESVGASFNPLNQSKWPPFRRHSIAESMSSLNLQSRDSSKLASTPIISHPETPKIEVPLAKLKSTKVGKRPFSLFVPVYSNVAHRPPLPTPITLPVTLPRKIIFEKRSGSNVHPTSLISFPSASTRLDCQVNKPSELPKLEFISNNQPELLAKRAQILTPKSMQSIPSTVTEHIYESIDCTEGSLYKPPGDSSLVTVSSADAVYLNMMPQKIPNEAITYHSTKNMKEKPTISSPINHTEIQEQPANITLGLLEVNRPLREISGVKIGLNNPMPTDIKEKEKPQMSPKPVFPTQKIPNEAITHHSTNNMKEKPTISSPINHTEIQEQPANITLGLPEVNRPLREISSVKIGLNNPMPIDIKEKEKPQIKSPKPPRMPSSGVRTDKLQVGSNSNPHSVEERIRIFNGNALENPTVGWHGYNTLKGAPSLNALNKMLELDKTPDRHLIDQYIQPTAISAGHAIINETTSPGAIPVIPEATDDSHLSDNSSEFSVELNEEEQGNAAKSGSPYSLETVINRFLMNEYAYIETLERICTARKSVSPELQNLLRGAEILYEMHVSMYKALYANRDSCSKIAGVFISYRDKLEFYKYYMLNSPDISNHIVDLPGTVRANHPLLTEDIKSSWKRIHYYFMNLEIMMSLSKEEEKSSVNESIILMKHLNMEADSGILIDGIKDTPYNLHLKAPILLHGSFKISGPGLKWGSIFYVLLFSELIIITSQKGNHYVYEMDIYIQQTNFIDTRQDNKFQLEVDRGRNKVKMNYTFKSSEGVKNTWVEQIKKLQLTIAQREKTERNKRFGIKLNDTEEFAEIFLSDK